MDNNVLRVDPTELRYSAGRMKSTAGDLSTAHGDAHSKIADLVTEFGESATASALRERLADWEAETRAHRNEVVRLHGNYLTCADAYETVSSHL